MQLVSVNVARARDLLVGKSSQQTGIFKEPVGLPVRVTSLGLAGDFIASKKHHGGPDQAIYIYTEPDYRWWEAELNTPLPFGMFGDNLVISGLESAQVAAGDRLVIGSGETAVILEATSPRIPCATLGAAMRDNAFVKRFRHAGRPGIYCRVIREGVIQVQQPVDYVPFSGERVTMLDQFLNYYEPVGSEAGIRRLLAAPIAIRARQQEEDRLHKLNEK
jgi:MOSC domain-containing protein YiiM